MGYPVATAGSTAQKSVGQRVGALAVVAGALYVIGYYLPTVEIDGGGSSFSDGDSAALWTWVVPGLIAALAGVMAMTGKRLAGAVAAGAAVGVAGFTVFELLLVDELASEMSDSSGIYSVSVSKGLGFWAMALAAVLGTVAIVMTLAGLAASGQGASGSTGTLAVVGGLLFVGVPLALLLPENGESPLSAMPTGALKAGLLAWALVSPVLGFAAVATRKQSGILAGVGVAIAHCGFSATMLLADDGGTGAFSTGHTAIYHWTAWGSLVLLLAAATQSAKSATSAPAGQASAAQATEGQWAADPYGRHQYRWYDGVRWTAQVSDSGVVGHDEPVSGPPPIPRDQWQPPHQ